MIETATDSALAYNSTISEDMKVLKYKAPGGQASNAKGGGGPWGVRRSLDVHRNRRRLD